MRSRLELDGRKAVLLALVSLPLLILLFLYGAPIPQDRGYHVFADGRTSFGIRNFSNVVSNIPFLLVGARGIVWCSMHPLAGALASWRTFFVGVALVSLGSAYYHLAPNDDALVWDRLPMTVAFMGLFVALLSEHLSPNTERTWLLPAITVGLGSVILWRITDDLRVYVSVQLAPLLAVPFLLAVFPGRYKDRHYLLYAAGFYVLAKCAEAFDREVYALTSEVLGGHALKHLLSAAAPYSAYLMLRRRTSHRSAIASSFLQ